MSQFSVDLYLKQRSAEDRIAQANRENARIQWAKDWMIEYHKRGRTTVFNWSPTITGTITKETTIEENKAEETVTSAAQEDRGGGQSQLGEAQGQRHFDRTDGDTPF